MQGHEFFRHARADMGAAIQLKHGRDTFVSAVYSSSDREISVRVCSISLQKSWLRYKMHWNETKQPQGNVRIF